MSSGGPYRPVPECESHHDPWPLDPAMIGTTDALPGYRSLRALGIVHGVGREEHTAGFQLGVAVDSRSVASYEAASDAALRVIMSRAVALGANAIVGVRFEATAWADGYPAVLAYGTAVRVEIDGG